MVRRKVFISTPHGRYNKFSLGIKKVLSPCLDLLYRQIIRHKKQDTADKLYYLSVCAIFKNEGPILKEWIEYHLLVGVDHFFL